MTKKVKILYVAGPGNVIKTFEHWCRGEDDPSQVSMTFSGQFYDLCTEIDAEGYILACPNERKFLKSGRFILEHRPVPFRTRPSVLYYLGQLLYQFSIVWSALWFRADVVIESDAECHFVLALLPRLGIQVVPSLHCVLWPKYLPLSKARKLITKLNGYFFARSCAAILSTSEDINEQLVDSTKKRPRPIINFLSTYRKSEFLEIKPPNQEDLMFQVLFAGRIETEKGVFDLLEIAKRFQSEGRRNIVFNLCGMGSVFDQLSEKVLEHQLESCFVLHGYCNKPKMRQMFSQAHMVIVPTKSNYVEGLNQVVIEGVLANRPVVTSSICPALSYVRGAVVEVAPDDVQGYSDAILKLQSDSAFYAEKQRQCRRSQEQFYSIDKSWAEAVKTALFQFVQVPQKATTQNQNATKNGIGPVLEKV